MHEGDVVTVEGESTAICFGQQQKEKSNHDITGVISVSNSGTNIKVLLFALCPPTLVPYISADSKRVKFPLVLMDTRSS